MKRLKKAPQAKKSSPLGATAGAPGPTGEATSSSQAAETTIAAEVVLEGSGDGILSIDRDRRIRSFNEAAEKLTGWKRGEAIGRPCFEVLRLEDDQGTSLCQIGCPVLKEVVGTYDMGGFLTTRDNRKLDVAMRYSLPQGGGGREAPVVMSIRDMRRLARAESLQSTLSAVVSHELQTPISIIKAYANTLARPDVQWDEATIRSKLQVIEEESDRLSGLVSRLLYTSRMDSEAMPLNRLAVDLPKEVHKVANRMAGLSEAHQVEVDFPPRFPAVYADPEKLADILTNLVDNAIKFSPDGGTIRVKGEVSGDEVLVTVADDGIGISPRDRELVFDRFYRADNPLTKATRGIGLGLHICKVTVEAHGGRMWVKSIPGRGSQFTFTLPVAKERSLG